MVQVKKPQEEQEESVNLNEIIVINEMQVKESQVQEKEHGTISQTGVDLQHRCREQDIEICAVKINLKNRYIVILAVYRAPTGDFDYFLKELEIVLNQLHDLVICGDFNVNYLEDSKNRQQLDTLLATFNLHATVKFPTRIMNGTVSAIDNIMVDKATNYTISPITNGLSEHDAQLLTSNIYLKIFQACFQKRKVSLSQMGDPWITKGIKISCARKRELYLITRQTNDVNTRNYYKRYCRILSNTIELAKKLHYDSVIAKAQNKVKTTWRIIKSQTNKTVHQTGIQSLKINNSSRTHPHVSGGLCAEMAIFVMEAVAGFGWLSV
ncbi:hypothetical protein Cfor_06702 [Coptotermes formosanus]|uniref:Endonuclease/exonuclease/phosphatase domain-containing protein n=1 Tax=Coptotermes formosanus TaxID=36987 RepID=A0A6L2QC37_COPFO|nr:hypothetical protein Cfor_06702 [Coptotermes formosanus]